MWARTPLLVAVAVLAASPAAALGAASNPKVTRGSGNTIVLTFNENTKNYGLHWWLDGGAYTLEDWSDRTTGCTKASPKVGVDCTWLPGDKRTGTVTVSMTFDKFVSPNTLTHVTIDSEGASGQAFDVLVEGTGDNGATQPPPTEEKPPEDKPKPPVDDPDKQKKKDAAAADLDFAVGSALSSCSVALGGAGLLAAGGITTVPLPVAGLPASSAGAMMASLAGPLCGLALQRLLQDYKDIKDPPDPNTGQVAIPATAKAQRPVGCRRYKKRARTTCSKLATAAAKVATAARRVDAVGKAINVTVDRSSTAIAANDATNAALQDASHRVLSGMLAASIRAQNAASAKLAKLLRRYHINIRLKAKGIAKGTQLTLKKLAALGVPAADLQQLAGPALKPKSIDVVKQLATAAPTARFDALARALTRDAANGYLAVFAGQLHITPDQAATQLRAAGAFLP